MAQVRPYRGIEAADRQAERRSRLLDAGLDILGSNTDLSELTVRGICRQAGVTARYFYESFNDKDDFIAAVFDWVIAGLTATTQAAVAAVPPKEQHRAAMANIVRTIADDQRIGRLVFSSHLAHPVLARKRVEGSGLLARLYRQDVGSALRVQAGERSKATAQFAVGGVGITISSWLAGDLKLTPDQLVDQLAAILDALIDPKLYRS